ncbi:bifunctional uridylyltransferase/uridylyl-removing protein GlnD [Avibacterium paragallinarum]|uniref:bifunctional uridylyltransferase/uridylyl-removing protein GlnD n=1 Tax=Avibacterium paragallinarum TaxID=728 RepID=UPI001029C43D|nr:bifunctional uridylyltransferase/uridylyl-removing protein GlnD [Avibacterium paragallinarum]RZN53087.1 bifunctional uridylyltransferase/uridylyl-removing protein GlnD [Avibacterium paragallinarum]
MFTYAPATPLTIQSVKQQKEQLKAFELAEFSACSVYALLANRTAFYDQLMQHLWQHFGLAEEPALSLIAVGGYGRGEMFPLSDLDFLILAEKEIAGESEQKISQMVQFLWDCGFDVGHAVRTLSQCEQEGKGDISIATNLLESRYLCGNQKTFEKLTALLTHPNFWRIEDFYHAKMAEKNERYQRYHNTSYNLEPDIKHSPGGLRDLHLLYWLALRHTGAKNLEDILQTGFIYPEEYALLQEKQHFLFKIRFALHLILKRYDNRLLFDRQVKISELLAYQGEGNQAVEQMMKAFFQALQTIASLTHLLTKHYREHFIDSLSQQSCFALDEHFHLANNAICLTNPQCFTQAPESILTLFYYFTQYPTAEIHSSTLRQLSRTLEHFHGYLCNFPLARETFLRLLQQPNCVKRAFMPMHQYGVLRIYLPQWKAIEGLMQFDLFHSYTVDEHTLRVMGKLEQFLSPEGEQAHPICSQLFRQSQDRRLLYLAALFHDIAKGRGGEHAELGAEDIAQFATLHGFSEQDIDLMQWLVAQHLLMSVTAQRRDIDDPNIVLEFAAEVKTEQRLDDLLCLTVADICATNETLWNSWKASLLALLYAYTKQQLEQGLTQGLDNRLKIEEHKTQALALLQREYPLLSGEDIITLWQPIPDEYFLRNNAKQICWHTQLLSEAGGNAVVKISNRFSAGGTEVFIYCQDQANLFNKVVSIIGSKQFSIHDAQIITADNGYVFDSFIVTELNGSLVRFDRRRELEQTLITGLNAEKIPTLSTVKNHHLKPFSVKTEVKFLHTDHPTHTEMELFALDKAGLLAEVSRIFITHGINLLNAKITTIGEKAEDFFILNKAGKALSAIERQMLEDNLLQRL